MKFARLLTTISLAAVFTLFSETITHEISFSASDFEIVKDTFTRVYLHGSIPSGDPGHPQTISKPFHFLLPSGSHLIAAEISSERWVPLTDGTPFPAQPPAILSIGSPGIIPPSIEAYSQNRFYPQNPLLSSGSGNLSGYSCANLCISPVRWNPFTGTCEYMTHADLILEYENSGEPRISPQKRTAFGIKTWESIISDLVENPEELCGYSIELDPDSYDWAVFVPSTFAAGLWHLQKIRRGWGLRDTILTFEDIYGLYSGIDDAEKLRNAITDLFIDHGISFALIVGDTALAPDRTVFAMDCEAGFYDDENQIRADLYFSDLDGSWNFDGDTIWGEIADSVDMYPELFIGRFSLNYSSQLNGLINKIEKYESLPSPNFCQSGLLLGQILWDDPYTDGGFFKDDLQAEVYPPDFIFGKVYARDGGTSFDALDSMDNGPNIINHAGHASSMLMCIDHGSCMFNSDMDLLNNSEYPSVMFSIGCWPAAFDKNCVAEHFVNNSDGGGVAFIGNSRYGWGSPGNPGFGYSEILDRAFWEEIFNGHEKLGEALNLSKIRYIPYARWENVWRWVIYELNILGDPAMPVITGYDPISLSYDISGYNLTANVENIAGEPLSNVIVSAHDNFGLINFDVTDHSGIAAYDISGGSPPIYITAHHGSEGFAAETLSTIGAGFFRADYSDTLGYNDASADPGDTVVVVFSFGGFDSPINGLSWNPTIIYGTPLWTHDPPTDITAYDSASCSAAFAIPQGIRPDTSLVVDPDLTHSLGDIGYPISFELNIPEFRVTGSILGDSDSSLDPGETAQLRVLWVNTGNGPSGGEAVFLNCPGGELEVSGSPSVIPLILPGDTAYVGPFDINWAPGQDPEPVVLLESSVETGTIDSFYLATRSLGFSHNAESSDDPFNIGSLATSLWHRTTRRSFSGDRSWWCGDFSSMGYWPNLDDYIYTDPFVLGYHTELRFMAYISFPNYGSDGLHVEFLGSSDTVEVDYLGSGGALLSFIVGWSEYRYQLDNTPFSPGDTIVVRFRFTSDDEDEAEGVFIDDIELRCQGNAFTTGIEESSPRPLKTTLHTYPNPFNDALRIHIYGDIPIDARLVIYDISGRLIERLDYNQNGIANWAGTYDNGNPAPSGVYLIRLISPGTVLTTRAVFIK